MEMTKAVIVIVGPTAVGKTALAIEVAKHFQTEIISADSRQVYREMKIGTAKPDEREMREAKHYLVNSHSIHDVFDAGQFADQADRLVDEILKTRLHAVLVGGSGLYVNAFCHGLDKMPEVKGEIREKLNEELRTNGLMALLEELQERDHDYFEIVDRNNPQRVIRALEVIRASGLPYSSFRSELQPKERPYQVIKIGLEMEREILYDRINLRMDKMISSGLFEEAEQLFPLRHLNALQTVGYQEVFGFLEGQYDKEEAVRLLKRNSRRYAKRQMTWFKRDEHTQWFRPDQKDEILRYIERHKR